MNNRNQMVSMAYFDTLSDAYVETIVQSQKQIYRNVNPVLTRRVSGRVLCLGSGPVMNFADTHTEQVVCLDLSENMLQRLPARDGVHPVCADAQRLPFADASFDFVVVPFLIHHMGMDTPLDTDRAVSLMLQDVRRVLKREGRLLVVDLFLPAILEVMLRSLYAPATALLNSTGRPMMYFYCIDNFRELLRNVKLNLDFDQRVDMNEKIMPTLLLPQFKVPASWHPARFHIIEATKIIT
jgi:ubiquinone/menaquinone biosynthesis C-methylase UbiE